MERPVVAKCLSIIKFAISTQSPKALWPAVSRQERLWGTGILLLQDFRGRTMQVVTEQPIKKFKFRNLRRVKPSKGKNSF